MCDNEIALQKIGDLMVEFKKGGLTFPEFIDKFERVCYNDISSSAMSNFADGYEKACVSTLMKVCFKAFDGDDRAEERLLIDLDIVDVDLEVVRV